MGGFFISGTDTNVGKTIVASIIVNKLDAIYYKPIQCGVDRKGCKDSDIIKKNCKQHTVWNETYFFKNPLSPNIAAIKEGKEVKMNKFKKIGDKNIKKQIIIEGAGGLNVPINDKKLVVDLVNFFNLPLILVCRTGLGTINHTLLSIGLLKSKKVKLHGLIFVGKRIKETQETIIDFGKKIYGKEINILGRIPKKKIINKNVINEMKKYINL